MSYTGGLGNVGGRAPGGEGQGCARGEPGSSASPPGVGQCPFCGHKMAPWARHFSFAPLTPQRLSSLRWQPCFSAPGLRKSWFLLPVSMGSGLGAWVLVSVSWPDLLGPLRPFSGVGPSTRSVDSAAVAIAIVSPAQFPCRMPQLPAPPPPLPAPGRERCQAPRGMSKWIFEGFRMWREPWVLRGWAWALGGMTRFHVNSLSICQIRRVRCWVGTGILTRIPQAFYRGQTIVGKQMNIVYIMRWSVPWGGCCITWGNWRSLKTHIWAETWMEWGL